MQDVDVEHRVAVFIRGAEIENRHVDLILKKYSRQKTRGHLRYEAEAMRGLILGEAALPAGSTVGGAVTTAVVWNLAILAVFFPLSVRLYRRAAG